MEGRRVLVEGMTAGFLGYAAVALFFAASNAVMGQSPFQTATALGTALGAGHPGPGEAAGIILAANGVHLVLSMLVGLASAWAFLEIEHHHGLWFAGMIAFLGGLMIAILVAGIVGAEITAVVTWTQAALATLLWILVVGAYFGRTHWELMRTLRSELEA